MNEKQFEQMIEAFGALTKVLAVFSIKDIEDTNQKMWLLHAMGFSNLEIAKIANKSKDAVRMALSRMKSDKSKGKGEEIE